MKTTWNRLTLAGLGVTALSVGLLQSNSTIFASNAHHFDGSKGEEVILQLMGMGPSATTRLRPEQGLFASSKTK